MLSDIEIAKQCKMQPIVKIAEKIGIYEDELELYGKYKAKLSDKLFERVKTNKDGKLILVTAINPTPAGEGKTTTTVGLGQALAKIGKKAIIALREPSLGPVFGVKGGAAGGGYSQVVPMEDINLHFTGDLHAIGAANNLLCAVLDNHLHQGNELSIDPRRILIKRVMDMNDRCLRQIIVGLGGKTNGIPREDGFMITVASEVMAILCLADDIYDLKKRLGNMLVAFSYDGRPIYCRDLKVEGAMAALLADAIKPNLIQTLEGTPCLMHGGPFANIAHGCNSVRATRIALKLADYVVTEAGFGADLGAEKFFDIKCRKASLKPSAVVLVATVRALKYNGGVKKEELARENIEALQKGLENLEAHIVNLRRFNLPIVVAINRFATDTENELALVKGFCRMLGVPCSFSEVFEKGGEGGIELAQIVSELADGSKAELKYLYDENESIEKKIDILVREYYGGSSVSYTIEALNAIKTINELGMAHLPICVAKTQYSLSDNPKLLGRPKGFTVTVRDVRLSAGAEFIVVLTGEIMTMPGLPKKPSAEFIDVGENGITGLF